MSDGYLNFTLSKDRYREQIEESKKLQEDSTFDSNKYLDRLSGEKDFLTHFEGERYRVNFETAEELEQSEKILTSDEELVQYYEKTDPQMLEGLKSKSSINIVGKKSEKKRLRKKYLDAHSDEMMEQTVAEQKFKEVRAKQKAEGYTEGTTVEAVKAKMKEEDIDAIMISYKLQNKSPKELKKIRKKISGLSYRRRQQLRNMTDKTIIDADQSGLDSEAVKQAQDKYAKTRDPNGTWKGYRLYREAREFEKNHQVPEDTEEKLKESGLHNSGEFLERTLNHFMKEVKYTEKDGKKVPASKEYEENLKYNQKFRDSLLSGNEDDWDFRFEEMEKILNDTWDSCSKYLRDLYDGKFNSDDPNINLIDIHDRGKKMLCLSGITGHEERSNFFRSKYYKNLSKEKQEEYDAKNDALNGLLFLLQVGIYKDGLNSDSFKFAKEAGFAQREEMAMATRFMLQENKSKVLKYL